MNDVAALIAAQEAPVTKRGPYKKKWPEMNACSQNKLLDSRSWVLEIAALTVMFAALTAIQPFFD